LQRQLSLHFFSRSILMAISPGGPGLADTRMSPFWMLLELRMMAAVVVTTGAVRRAKLDHQHHQQTITQLLTGQMPFLSPKHQCTSIKGSYCNISCRHQLKGSVKEPNTFHVYETEKITCKASDAAEYIELFGSFTRDRHARCI